PPNNELALASALERLVTEQGLRAKLAHDARSFARSNYAQEQVLKQYESLYLEILDQKKWKPHSRPEQKPVPTPKVRVAIVDPALRYVGGPSIQADLLLHHWQGDPEVEVSFIPADPPFPWCLRWTERIPVLRTIMREPLYLKTLYTGLNNIDVVHLFAAAYW